MNQSPTILLDTNFWLDYYLEERLGHANAEQFLLYAKENNLNLIYAAASIKDVYYLLQNELKRQTLESEGELSENNAIACNKIAWACVSNMTDHAAASPVGESEIWLALRFEKLHSDFEDDLILGAYETSKADYLVTSDKKFASKAPANAFTPSEMIAFLQVKPTV